MSKMPSSVADKADKPEGDFDAGTGTRKTGGILRVDSVHPGLLENMDLALLYPIVLKVPVPRSVVGVFQGFNPSETADFCFFGVEKGSMSSSLVGRERLEDWLIASLSCSGVIAGAESPKQLEKRRPASDGRGVARVSDSIEASTLLDLA